VRVSREQVLENKRTILKAAGRLFRERGFESVTVTDVMKAAGLTHGGFYGYFKSKDDLIAQAVGEALSRSEAAIDDLPAFRERYLSPDHRDDFAGGCPVAALASETIRQERGARATMTSSLKRQIELLSRTAPAADKAHKRRAAIGSWAAMVGALILARMSDESDLSDEILSETRAWLAAQDRKSGRPHESARVLAVLRRSRPRMS
jgi:TetR/AcrR family transcriptional regulator, transcriptional repressor for nem operon